MRYFFGSTETRPVVPTLIYDLQEFANIGFLVVDVLIQHQPHITALVWGGIRSLLSVCFLIQMAQRNLTHLITIGGHQGN